MSDLLDDIMKAISENGVCVRFESVTENSCEGETVIVKKFSHLDFSEHDKAFEDKIASLEENVGYYKDSFYRAEKNCDKLYNENKELKQRIAELESKNEQLKCDIDKMATSKSEWIDRAVEWQQKCEKLESKETSELSFDPLECANYLINATYERETSSLERGLKGLPEKVNSDRYTVDDLEQIAEHLLVYCKHNKESE